jgi:hypothetical protein
MIELELQVIKTNEKITFESFLESVEKSDFTNLKDISNIANQMHKLSLNEEELIKILLNYSITGDQVKNLYAENSLICAVFKQCSVRLNFWHPTSDILDLPHIKSELHIYGMHHDHNFDFLTVGMWGPGYMTEVYSYDRDTIDGYIGEKVNPHYHGLKQLQRGDVHFYRKSHHIHSQIAPTELSISLNVLIDPEISDIMDEQFRFKQDSNQECLVIDRAEMAATNGLLGMAQPFINMLNEYGYDDIEPLLHKLTNSKNHYVRLDAYKNLYANYSEESKNEILIKIKNDPSILVQNALLETF